MSRKFARGEGADGLFLKTLTECIGRLGAIDPSKAQALRELFHAELSKDARVIENPKDALRHEGAVLERLFSKKPVAVPEPEPIPVKPDVTIPEFVEALTKEKVEPAPSLGGADYFTGGDDFGLGDIDIEPEPVNPFIATDGVLKGCLDEWMRTRKHPYVRNVLINGKQYTIIGTAVVHGQNGNSVNINCTTGGAKKIRECDENVLVHFNGRPVTMSVDAPNGTAFFVWLCHYSPGRVFRFWMNRSVDGNRKDDPRGTFRILITKDGDGWRKVAA